MVQRYLAIAAALCISSTAMAAPAIIDTFDDGVLPEYTFRKILDQNAGTTNIAFQESGGSIRAVSTGTTGAEQALFMRNTSLSVGDQLVVDLVTPSSGSQDIGLAIASSTLPTSLTGAGDTRANSFYLNVFARAGNAQVLSSGANGAAVLASSQAFPVGVTGLFIARTDATTFDLGYLVGSARTVLVTRTGQDASTATQIGFYTDMRADGAVVSSLDNLQFTTIPEPSSLALLGLGGLACLRRRRA